MTMTNEPLDVPEPPAAGGVPATDGVGTTWATPGGADTARAPRLTVNAAMVSSAAVAGQPDGKCARTSDLGHLTRQRRLVTPARRPPVCV